jgi:uncharacterized protein (TIGR02677 family)
VTSGALEPRERQTLGALRYAVNEEAASYLAIMRLFTSGMSGFLSDQSAADVVERLAAEGIELDQDVVEQRLSYLVEHGNLARSPRETEARSVREYLTNRARYQLTQRGELVHRQVEELLEHSETAREVSSEVLPVILAGIEDFVGVASRGLDQADPRELAGRITTLFAQFEVLVSSTRQFYSYLTQVLTRFDLGRDEFELFKSALLDYLQRFVDEISRHMPQVGDRLRELQPSIESLCARANAGERLVGLDGSVARRATGLEPGDWQSLYAWFVGSTGRRSDAENVRALATDAMRSLLVNLRRIAAGADRQQSRYGDLTRLAGWFEVSSDEDAHALWASVFGLYPARHLAFKAESDHEPVPATQSWWTAPAAEVPVGLRVHGDRTARGRAGARVNFTAAKQARLAERARQQRRREEALRELAGQAGTLREARLSDAAREVFLDLYSDALTGRGRPLVAGSTAQTTTSVGDGRLTLAVARAPGSSAAITSPSGKLVLHDIEITVHLAVEDDSRQRTGSGA